MQCNLCGTEYDEKTAGSIPPCPECLEVACSYPKLFKWITKVVNFAVDRAVWVAGEHLYAHQKYKKHETNTHYLGRMM
jgi:hypothetical protein